MSETSTAPTDPVPEPAEGAQSVDTPGESPGESPVDPSTGDQSEGAEGAEDSTQKATNREAAKYRTRLRETEAQRDALTARLETLQRNEIQRLAADRLADPADLWRDGGTVADLLDAAGNVDPGKVRAAVAETIAAHPHWAKTVTPKPNVKNLKSGTDLGIDVRGNWTDVLAGRQRH